MMRYMPFFVGLILLSIGCSPRVIHFTNPSSDFETYQTFYVVNYKANNAQISAEGAEIITEIEELINGEMVRRSYDLSAKSPDLLVRYEVISNQRTEVTRNINNPYYPSLYWGNSFSMRTFLESALLIEIMDLNTRKIVWQASVDLNKYTKTGDRDELLEKAIIQLFNSYLYRAGSNKPDETLTIDK